MNKLVKKVSMLAMAMASFIGAYDYVIQKDPYEEFIKKHESD